MWCRSPCCGQFCGRAAGQPTGRGPQPDQAGGFSLSLPLSPSYTHNKHTHIWHQGQALWLLWGNAKMESKNICQHVTSRAVYNSIDPTPALSSTWGCITKKLCICITTIWLANGSVAAQKVQLLTHATEPDGRIHKAFWDHPMQSQWDPSTDGGWRWQCGRGVSRGQEWFILSALLWLSCPFSVYVVHTISIARRYLVCVCQVKTKCWWKRRWLEKVFRQLSNFTHWL